MLLDDLAQLTQQKGVFLGFMGGVVALPLRVVPVVNCNFVLMRVGLKNLSLILLEEVNNEERVLKADEEVAFVRSCLLRLILLVGDGLNPPESTLVTPVDLLLELFL